MKTLLASTPAAPTAGTNQPHVGAEIALSVRGVSKSFKTVSPLSRLRLPWRARPNAAASHAPPPVKAVDGVSLEVRKGEIVGVLGANGSGKSTLIRLISTLLIPDSGTVEVFGVDVVRGAHEVKRLINRVSVDAAFFKKLSPMENLTYAARLYGLEIAGARSDALAILSRLGISRAVAYAPMEDMSRGMQQKVAIARAFLSLPALLLLDEPTTGLDPRSKKDVQAFVRELRQRHGVTVLLTTHDMDEADRLCDRVAVLNQGKIIALDTPIRLKADLRERGELDHQPSLEDVFMHLTGLTVDEVTGEVGEVAGGGRVPAAEETPS